MSHYPPAYLVHVFLLHLDMWQLLLAAKLHVHLGELIYLFQLAVGLHMIPQLSVHMHVADFMVRDIYPAEEHWWMNSLHHSLDKPSGLLP